MYGTFSLAQKKFSLNGHSDPITECEISVNGKWIVSISKETLKIWDIETGANKYSRTGFQSNVFVDSLSPNGNIIGFLTMSNEVNIWDLEASTVKYSILNAQNCIVSSNSKWILHYDGFNLSICDFETGNIIYTKRYGETWKNYIQKCVISPNAKWVICFCDIFLKILDLVTGIEVLTVQYSLPIERNSISPNGNLIVIAEQSKMILWDFESGTEKYSRTANINKSFISPDGKYIVSNLTNGNVNLWDLESGDLKYTLLGHNAMVSCDNNWIISTSNGALQIYDINMKLFYEIDNVDKLVGFGYNNDIFFYSLTNDLVKAQITQM